MSASSPVVALADVSPHSSPAVAGADSSPDLAATSLGFASTETTIVELTSTTATTSAFPESFGLSISGSGRWILAYSSSALYILAAQRLPEYRQSGRAFKLRRKPLAAAITDGGKLAILTTPHKVDIYQCGEGTEAPLTGASQAIEAVHLDYEAHTIALTAEGDVVAAGSDGGIELRNLSSGALPTDKRQITCGPLDAISFSGDGRSLLVTAAARRTRTSTFISVNGAYEDAMFDDEAFNQLPPLGKLWITQLLFPERVQARQAVFLPDADTGQICELLAFDSEKDRYRLFDINTKQFLDRSLGPPEDFRWTRSERMEDALPAVSGDASHIAVAVRLKDSSEIWLYHVPRLWRDVDSAHDSGNDLAEQLATLTPSLRLRLPHREDNQPAERLVSLRWLRSNVNSPSRGRLFALVSTVTLSMPEDVVPSEAPAASGKIFVFDLVRASNDLSESSPRQVTIDLDSIPPVEHLAEEQIGLEQEVDLVRRRTTRAQRGRDLSGLSSPRDPRPARRSLSSGSSSGNIVTLRDLAESGGRPRRRRSFSSMSSMSEENLDIPPLAADEPYTNQQQRSQFSLHRAATVAANSAAGRAHLRSLPNQPLEYRRADGMREIPHESDADDWVPPPPPYSERPDPPGPNAVSLAIDAMPGSSLPAQRPQSQNPVQGGAQVPPDPLPSLSIPPVAPTQLSPSPSAGPNMAGASPGPSPQGAIVARRPIPQSQPPAAFPLPQQSSNNSPPVQTNISSLPPRVQSLQNLSPPGPGALQSPSTFPPAARSPYLVNSNVQTTLLHTNVMPRSMSTPSSPLDSVTQRSRSGIDATDFHPAMQLPTPEQLEGLRRRSSSSSSVPTAAIGAMGRLSSTALNRPLPPLPQSTGNSSDRSQFSSMRERNRARPILTRLATIASVVSSASAMDPPPQHMSAMSAPPGPHSEPTTPTGHRARWRGTFGRASALANFETVDSGRQSAIQDDSFSSARNGSKKRGLKCIVM